MTKWMTYLTPLSDQQMAICFMEDGSVISGIATTLVEYQTWLAEGNEPEEWKPE